MFQYKLSRSTKLVFYSLDGRRFCTNLAVPRMGGIWEDNPVSPLQEALKVKLDFNELNEIQIMRWFFQANTQKLIIHR